MPSRYKEKPKVGKTCEECGGRYQTKRDAQRYCSAICRFRAWDKAHPRLRTEVQA